MAFLIVVSLILATWSSQAMSRTLHEAGLIDMHEQWMSQYGRTYANIAEKEKRFQIFKDNLNYVEKFNKDGNRTYKLGMNKFLDMTNEEFLSYFTGYKQPSDLSRSSSESSSFMYENLTDIPANVDWRNQGAVTDVKHQGRCGKTTSTCNTYFHVTHVHRSHSTTMVLCGRKKKKKSNVCSLR